jgi:catecholate siderophore receptor
MVSWAAEAAAACCGVLRNLTVQLNLYNLGDKVYYSGIRSPHYATMAAGRSAVASLKWTY